MNVKANRAKGPEGSLVEFPNGKDHKDNAETEEPSNALTFSFSPETKETPESPEIHHIKYV